MAEEKKDGFVVSDKRKFTIEGELRPDAADEPKPTSSAPPASTPPAAPAAPNAAPPQAEEEMPPPPTAAEQAGQHEEYRKGTKQLDDMLSARGHAAGQQFQMSFGRFIESLYMTALIQLGAIRPEGAGEQVRVDIIGARQTIDTIGLLQEKTKGNLTPEEERLLQTVLFELRMAFVEMTNALNKAAMQPPPGATPPKK